MKKLSFTLIVCSCLLSAVDAKVYTVSNNPNAPAQYSDITPAITAASSGDTIYIQGSPNTYNTTTYVVNKKLTLIGAGYDISNTDFKYATVINYINFDSAAIVSAGGVSGAKLIGLNLSGVSFGTNHVHNVTIDRCYISYITVGGNNWLIKNSYIYSYISGYYVATNLTVTNNIFVGAYLSNMNLNSIFITNNLFLNNTGQDLTSSSLANVNNNIFYNNTAGQCASCLYNNNIAYYTSAVTFPGSGTGNYTQHDPAFVVSTPAIPIPGNNIPYASIKTYNWTLQASSVGHNAGGDGKDIGIYGGLYPWPNFTGQSNIPLVQSFIIQNPVVQTNGTLNITVKAKKMQ